MKLKLQEKGGQLWRGDKRVWGSDRKTEQTSSLSVRAGVEASTGRLGKGLRWDASLRCEDALSRAAAGCLDSRVGRALPKGALRSRRGSPPLPEPRTRADDNISKPMRVLRRQRACL